MLARRARVVREEMTQMAATRLAKNFDATHPHRRIFMQFDRTVFVAQMSYVSETRPADQAWNVRFVFAIALEKHRTATGAGILTAGIVVEQGARARCLCTPPPQHSVLLGGEFLPPIIVGHTFRVTCWVICLVHATAFRVYATRLLSIARFCHGALGLSNLSRLSTLIRI